MPESTGAVQTALHYFTALTAGDLSRAMRYVADDVICDTQTRRVSGSRAYRQFISQCLPVIRGAMSVAGADRLVVDKDKIVNIVTVVDRVPYQAGPTR
ncbi:nuclear transport factor 2 family protein [Nocardia sp. NPDC056952]|uniref:nuclear transport factor 2 family protein n=1 Tax=Nocardia sp. NPDC056952 TaxID=3345979 RepID=UPI00362DEBB1